MDIFRHIGYRGNIKPYDKRVPKTQLFLQNDLSVSDRELLSERVEEVRLVYVLNQHTYPMDIVKNSAEQYDSIFFVTVKLKSEISLQRLSRIIHNSFQTPTVLIFDFKDRYLFSSALKRINQNEKGKVVIEEIFIGNWIDLNALTATQDVLLSALNFDKLRALDYKQSYMNIHRLVYEECNADITSRINAGSFEELKQKTEAKKEVIQEIERLMKMLNKKSVSLKERVELAGRIEELKKE